MWKTQQCNGKPFASVAVVAVVSIVFVLVVVGKLKHC